MFLGGFFRQIKELQYASCQWIGSLAENALVLKHVHGLILSKLGSDNAQAQMQGDVER